MLFLFKSLIQQRSERHDGRKKLYSQYNRITHPIHPLRITLAPKTYFRPGAIPIAGNSIFFAPSFRAHAFLSAV